MSRYADDDFLAIREATRKRREEEERAMYGAKPECAQCGAPSDYDDDNDDPICEQCDTDWPKGAYWTQEDEDDGGQ